MSNKGPVGFQRMTSLFMNIFIGIVLGSVFLFLSHDVSVMQVDEIVRTFVQSLIMSIPVGYAVGDFLPTMEWGQKIARRLRVTSKPARHLVVSLTLAVVNVTIILTLCMFIALLANMSVVDVLAIISALWLPAVLAGFVAIFALLPGAQKIAAKISGFSPESAHSC